MTSNNIRKKGICRVRVFRYDPAIDTSPRYEDYEVPYFVYLTKDGQEIPMRIMAVLDYIRNELNVDLAYRATCGIGRCGTCGVLVNGEPKLACLDAAQENMIIEPLPNLPIIRDLVVDRSSIDENLKDVKPYLERTRPYTQFPEIFSHEEASMLKYNFKLARCLDCGLCYSGCPLINRSKFYGPEALVHIARFAFDPRDSQEKRLESAIKSNIFYCTTCKRCEQICPMEVEQLKACLDLRNLLVEKGQIPQTIKAVFESIFKYGNPWGISRAKRSDWIGNLKIDHISQAKEPDILLFVGCESSYDTRLQSVARSIAEILNKINVSYAILGNDENCCGNEIYSLGEKGLFEVLVESNLKTFSKYNIDKILTISPHCFNAFKNRYGKHELDVLHYTQFIAEMIDNEKLKLSKKIDKVVTYQDPCFLSRHNNIVDEPRKIIENIPGLEFRELKFSKEKSVCCGGGGGRMWLEVEEKERLAETRVKESVGIGADLILVACPFCLLTFEDAIKSSGNEGKIQVLDLMELTARAL